MTRKVVAAAIDEISTIRLGRGGIRDLARPIHEVVGGRITALHCERFDPMMNRIRLDFFEEVGMPLGTEASRSAYERLLAASPVPLHSYVPDNPDEWQRNRVLTCEEIIARKGMPAGMKSVYSLMGASGHKTLRVLVCEGPSLLSYVGSIQPDRHDARQRFALGALVPALQRRLTAERLLSAHGRGYDALHAVMTETASAAYLVQRGSGTVYANARAQRPRERAQIDAIRHWLSSPPPGVTVTELRDTDGASMSLVVVKRRTSKDEVASFAQSLGLTAAQKRVLEHVLDGQANATIAARLNVTERTVEAHLTAIYGKAGVPSRAALIALFLRRTEG